MSHEFQAIKKELQASEAQEHEYEEFYENMEAPKFVDFTTPDHYCPNDKYWFCQRVGCDRKHEELIDSEAISKDFVLRVMAARSPNVRLQKALNRTALSKTIKCPMSAPPKSSRPRVSKLALVSSLCGKFADGKGDDTKPQPKIVSCSTPKAKMKQVAAKYLTTPRNRQCLQSETSFRSVQHPKPLRAASGKDRTVVKALVFHSPKKTISIKTSVELRLSKLRSQKKTADPLRKRVTFKEESNVKLQSAAHPGKAKVISSRSPKKPTKRVAEKGPELTLTDEIPREFNGEDIASCMENPSSPKPIVMKESDLPKSEVPNIEDASRGVEIESMTDSDDKENSSAIDANRCLNKGGSSEARSKIIPNGSRNLKKAVQLVDKITKDSMISIKVKKPKPTHPKPFRFRTDERGILKEAANMEKKVHLASRTEPVTPLVEGKSKRRLVKDIRRDEKHQDKCNSEICQRDEKHQDKCNSEITESTAQIAERKILAEVTGKETIQVAQEGFVSAAAKPNRLMQVRKMKSPHELEMAKPEREAKSSSTVPAQKRNMIKKTLSSPGTRPRKTMNRKENNGAADCKSSQKRIQRNQTSLLPIDKKVVQSK